MGDAASRLLDNAGRRIIQSLSEDPYKGYIGKEPSDEELIQGPLKDEKCSICGELYAHYGNIVDAILFCTNRVRQVKVCM